LAHHGVLFLDELPEFPRAALEALREPMESGCVTISRSAQSAEFPARFQLIAAMNPCPCGYAGHAKSPGQNSPVCRCTPDQVHRYSSKVSGPLLDRIDLHVEVPSQSAALILNAPAGESTASLKKRCHHARAMATERQGCSNQALSGAALDKHGALRPDALSYITQVANHFSWSGRSSHRVLKIARTIADLAQSPLIEKAHIAEAVQYRRPVAGHR
jgi:magnesium chelatase family protein